MHLAICSDNENFKRDKLRDKEWSRQFPGSGWVTCIYNKSIDEGFEAASGDVAIKKIQEGKWSANEVYVVQDLMSSDASKLIHLGANPLAIMCYEASIYAPLFYEKINEISEPFKYKLGYGFDDERLNGIGAVTIRFPSFFQEDILDFKKWGDRREISMVAGNKYRVKNNYIPARPNVLNLMRQLRHCINKIKYNKYEKSLERSLHDERLRAVEYFSNKQKIDIYGVGWERWDEHPTEWASRLSHLVTSRYKGMCIDKISTISNYRFNLCYENMVEKGYVTEKIIDCLVAGTVPLYLGAADIEQYIPAESFVDKREFDSYEELQEYMNKIDEEKAVQMIMAGRDFLNTKEGRLHSYEGFAQYIFEMVSTC